MGPKALEEDWLAARTEYTKQLFLCPYDPRIYIRRAECHEELRYPDLAAGDAYKALLLTDEVEDGEFYEQVREALASGEHSGQYRGQMLLAIDPELDNPLLLVARKAAVSAYIILTRALTACGDMRAAFDFAERGLESYPEDQRLQHLFTNIGSQQQSQLKDGVRLNPKIDLPRAGLARREIYPWNIHEPNRFSDDVISFLNAELQSCSSNCEIKMVDLPLLSNVSAHALGHSQGKNGKKTRTIRQLGLFATRTITPGEVVLLEPSILTANNRLLDPLCDACSAPLPPLSPESPLPTCDSCADIYFCSDTCLDRAQEMYHPAICGIEDFDVVAKDPSAAAATSSLYLLLVARTMAMAITQDKHPLELPQVKYLWGDFTLPSASAQRDLPFNFETNIAQPIHVLIKMDIDPFAAMTLERFDFWVLNTLFAKFRGVASAKMNPHTLRPDIAAVHPLWSMANHSCAPNVLWEWGAEDGELRGREKGAMGFIARGGKDIVHWGEKERVGGIKKGKEVLNHYCDVDMTVHDRRGWAVGALGGLCQCERCLWEQNNNDREDSNRETCPRRKIAESNED